VARNTQFVYVANQNGVNIGSVSAYAVALPAGALVSAPGSPFSAGRGPVSVAIDPSVRFVYAANQEDNTLSMFGITTGTGALTPLGLGPVSTGLVPTAVVVDPTGQFVYVA